jgi:methylmalonyl-CoA mutase cobalamin-binding subunit
MAQACFVAAHARCISLGPQTPVSQILEAAHAQSVDAVALSFSKSFKLAAAQQVLRELRARLDPRVQIWLGGSLWERVRASTPGVTIVARLSEIEGLLAEYRAGNAASEAARS